MLWKTPKIKNTLTSDEPEFKKKRYMKEIVTHQSLRVPHVMGKTICIVKITNK